MRYNAVMTVERRAPPRRKSDSKRDGDLPRIPGVIFLTPEEAWEMYDSEAHDALGISADEFDRALAAGEFDDRIEEPSVLRVYMIRTTKPGK
jgi:hypothetical protein